MYVCIYVRMDVCMICMYGCVCTVRVVKIVTYINIIVSSPNVSNNVSELCKGNK